TAQESSSDGAHVPAAEIFVVAARAIEIAQRQILSSHQPIVRYQHAGDRSQAARITNQPIKNIAGWIGEQPPRLHQDTDDAGDQSTGPERNKFRERIRKIIRRRDYVGGDVDGERRYDDGEHRDRDDNNLMELADEFHRVPEITRRHLRIDDHRRGSNHHTHRREYCHRRWQRHDLAQRLLALAVTEAREVRHVERERGPKSDHAGQGNYEGGPEFAEAMELALLAQQITEAVCFPNGPAEQERGHHQHEWRCPILDFSEQVHAAIDDVD